MKEYQINTVEQLFRFVSLENSFWPYHYGTHDLVFRGQADENWNLYPSAFRKLKRRITIRQQIENEFEIIHDFARDLSQQGIYHPPTTLPSPADLIDSLQRINSIGRSEDLWPSKDYYEIIGIAQHFGLPTRFLDFSFDPKVALYFAAKDSFKKKIKTRMSLYILDVTNHRLMTTKLDKINTFKYRQRYQVIQPPTIFNSNLKAQRGIFVGYFDDNFKSNNTFNPLKLDEYVGDEIMRILIPADLNIEILYRLSKNFIDARSLYPGVDGIVKYMKEESPIYVKEDFKIRNGTLINNTGLPDMNTIDLTTASTGSQDKPATS